MNYKHCISRLFISDLKKHKIIKYHFFVGNFCKRLEIFLEDHRCFIKSISFFFFGVELGFEGDSVGCNLPPLDFIQIAQYLKMFSIHSRRRRYIFRYMFSQWPALELCLTSPWENVFLPLRHKDNNLFMQSMKCGILFWIQSRLRVSFTFWIIKAPKQK